MEENRITDDAIRNLLRQEALPEVRADFTLRVMGKLNQSSTPVRNQTLIPPAVLIGAVVFILASLIAFIWQYHDQLEWKQYGFMVIVQEWMRGWFISIRFSVSSQLIYLLIICCLFFIMQLLYIRRITQRT